VEFGAHRFSAGLQEEHAAQPLRDALDAKGGVLSFHRQNLLGDGPGDFALARVRTGGFVVQTLLAELTIAIDPSVQSADGNVQLGGNGLAGKALLQEQADGAALELGGIAIAGFGPARHPPRGVRCSLLLYRLINFFIMHGNTPFNIGVSTIYPLILVS
jgi:hypothetical protein